jgi:hypothetical protein
MNFIIRPWIASRSLLIAFEVVNLSAEVARRACQKQVR